MEEERVENLRSWDLEDIHPFIAALKWLYNLTNSHLYISTIFLFIFSIFGFLWGAWIGFAITVIGMNIFGCLVYLTPFVTLTHDVEKRLKMHIPLNFAIITLIGTSLILFGILIFIILLFIFSIFYWLNMKIEESYADNEHLFRFPYIIVTTIFLVFLGIYFEILILIIFSLIYVSIELIYYHYPFFRHKDDKLTQPIIVSLLILLFGIFHLISLSYLSLILSICAFTYYMYLLIQENYRGHYIILFIFGLMSAYLGLYLFSIFGMISVSVLLVVFYEYFKLSETRRSNRILIEIIVLSTLSMIGLITFILEGPLFTFFLCMCYIFFYRIYKPIKNIFIRLTWIALNFIIGGICLSLTFFNLPIWPLYTGIYIIVIGCYYTLSRFVIKQISVNDIPKDDEVVNKKTPLDDRWAKLQAKKDKAYGKKDVDDIKGYFIQKFHFIGIGILITGLAFIFSAVIPLDLKVNIIITLGGIIVAFYGLLTYIENKIMPLYEDTKKLEIPYEYIFIGWLGFYLIFLTLTNQIILVFLVSLVVFSYYEISKYRKWFANYEHFTLIQGILIVICFIFSFFVFNIYIFLVISTSIITYYRMEYTLKKIRIKDIKLRDIVIAVYVALLIPLSIIKIPDIYTYYILVIIVNFSILGYYIIETQISNKSYFNFSITAYVIIICILSLLFEHTLFNISSGLIGVIIGLSYYTWASFKFNKKHFNYFLALYASMIMVFSLFSFGLIGGLIFGIGLALYFNLLWIFTKNSIWKSEKLITIYFQLSIAVIYITFMVIFIITVGFFASILFLIFIFCYYRIIFPLSNYFYRNLLIAVLFLTTTIFFLFGTYLSNSIFYLFGYEIGENIITGLLALVIAGYYGVERQILKNRTYHAGTAIGVVFFFIISLISKWYFFGFIGSLVIASYYTIITLIEKEDFRNFSYHAITASFSAVLTFASLALGFQWGVLTSLFPVFYYEFLRRKWKSIISDNEHSILLVVSAGWIFIVILFSIFSFGLLIATFELLIVFFYYRFYNPIRKLFNRTVVLVIILFTTGIFGIIGFYSSNIQLSIIMFELKSDISQALLFGVFIYTFGAGFFAVSRFVDNESKMHIPTFSFFLISCILFNIAIGFNIFLFYFQFTIILFYFISPLLKKSKDEDYKWLVAVLLGFTIYTLISLLIQAQALIMIFLCLFMFVGFEVYRKKLMEAQMRVVSSLLYIVFVFCSIFYFGMLISAFFWLGFALYLSFTSYFEGELIKNVVIGICFTLIFIFIFLMPLFRSNIAYGKILTYRIDNNSFFS